MGWNIIINLFIVSMLTSVCSELVGCRTRIFGLYPWIMQGDFNAAAEKINAKQGRDHNWAGYLEKKKKRKPDSVIFSVFSLRVHQVFTITCLANWSFAYFSWFRRQNHMLLIIMDFLRAQSYHIHVTGNVYIGAKYSRIRINQ